jgi:uracil-DNA glycosylase family 4
VSEHPADELSLLAGALRLALERAARRGHRRIALPRESPATPGAPSAAPGGPARRAAPTPAATPPPAAAPEASPADALLRASALAAPDLDQLRALVAHCTACSLCETRSRTVFGEGPPRARLMFVGEAPGEEEDRRGEPFVGRAGQLLTDIIEKGMRMARSEVYIANVLKCRPPGNRDPLPGEKALCTAWLERQIELVDPEVIVPLGRHAAGHLLGTDAPLGRLRGRVHPLGPRKVVPTYHPAFLLRQPERKRECWQDIQLAMRALGLATGQD